MKGTEHLVYLFLDLRIILKLILNLWWVGLLALLPHFYTSFGSQGVSYFSRTNADGA